MVIASGAQSNVVECQQAAPWPCPLDVCVARVRPKPHVRIFANPRSCFSFRFEGANAVLLSTGKGN